MKTRIFCFLLALQIVSLVSVVVVANRPFPPSKGMSHPGPIEAPGPMSSPPNTVESEKGLMGREVISSSTMEEAFDKEVSKIGSSPPSCDHKCYGCTPCEAIQVPSTSRLGLHYANYEPESWKCKCGPSLYSP